MGEFTITRWKCDRCGQVMDKRPGPYGEAGTFSLKANCDYAVAGDGFAWNDLCPTCNTHVGRLISELRKEAREEAEEEPKQ